MDQMREMHWLVLGKCGGRELAWYCPTWDLQLMRIMMMLYYSVRTYCPGSAAVAGHAGSLPSFGGSTSCQQKFLRAPHRRHSWGCLLLPCC